MVRGEEDLLVCHPQADLTRGMAGGSNDLQGIFPHGEPVPVLQGLVIGQVQVRTQGPGRLVPVVIRSSSRGKPSWRNRWSMRPQYSSSQARLVKG